MSPGKYEKPSSSRYWVLRVLSGLIGYEVEVYLQDESIICGVFSGANSKQWSGIVLENAKINNNKESDSYTYQKLQTMILKTADIVYILAKECEKELMVALDQHRDRVHNCQLSSTSFSIQQQQQQYHQQQHLQQQHQQHLQQQHQPQQEQQLQSKPKQCLQRKFGKDKFEGMTTLVLQDTPTNIEKLGFLSGRQCCPYKMSEKNVVVREYYKDMKSFFLTMRKIKHINILKARAKFPVTDLDGCVIAYGPVEETLASFFKRLKETKPRLSEENNVALIARVMRQILTALIHAHTLESYHGRLTWNDVYICTDSSYRKNQPEHINVRLSFAEQEENAIKFPDNEAFLGSKCADFKSAADMLQNLVNFLELDNKEEFSLMISQIRENEDYTLENFNWESVIWSISLKISFVRFIAKYMFLDLSYNPENMFLDLSYNPENFKDLEWTKSEPVREYCEKNKMNIATYKNRISDYVRFIDNTFSYLGEYDSDVEVEKIMKRFVGFTPRLFYWLADFAQTHNLRDEFMNSRKMFLG